LDPRAFPHDDTAFPHDDTAQISPAGERRRAGGTRVWDLGWEPEMTEDPLNHCVLLDERDQAQTPANLLTFARTSALERSAADLHEIVAV
jgi:hypothetical protein